MGLYGIDVLNGVLLSLQKYHPEMVKSGEEMSKLALIYSNFVLGSCLNLKEKNVNVAYKKLKSVLRQVKQMYCNT